MICILVFMKKHQLKRTCFLVLSISILLLMGGCNENCAGCGGCDYKQVSGVYRFNGFGYFQRIDGRDTAIAEKIYLSMEDVSSINGRLDSTDLHDTTLLFLISGRQEIRGSCTPFVLDKIDAIR
jgi:hypothetical protein